MSKKFPELTVAWLKKNIPAVAETKEFHEDMKEVLTEDIDSVLDGLDNDKALDMNAVTKVKKANDKFNKHAKVLLATAWKDSKTKKIPTTVNLLETKFKLLFNLVVSAAKSQDKAQKDAREVFDLVELEMKQFAGLLDKAEAASTKIEKALSGVEAKLLPTTPADQKKQMLAALATVIKANASDELSGPKLTRKWHASRTRLDDKFPDGPDKKAAFKLVEDASKRLAKQVSTSDALNKRIASLAKK